MEKSDQNKGKRMSDWKKVGVTLGLVGLLAGISQLHYTRETEVKIRYSRKVSTRQDNEQRTEERSDLRLFLNSIGIYAEPITREECLREREEGISRAIYSTDPIEQKKIEERIRREKADSRGDYNTNYED